jgi:pseudaminic acid cytidylyltransferase
MASERHLAVIPARGGSKRLPRKNIIDFLDRPIISYTIDAAREAGLFDRIVVSTEDEEIAEVAERFGGKVDRRPPDLAGDDVGVAAVCRELIGRFDAAGERYASLTVLYATAPLRRADDVCATFELLEPGVCDYAMAVTEFVQPVHQALTAGPDRILEPVFPDRVRQRKDEQPRYFAGNGSTYSVRMEAFLTTGGFYGSGLRGHVMPLERSIDIDTREDLELALFHAGRR